LFAVEFGLLGGEALGEALLLVGAAGEYVAVGGHYAVVIRQQFVVISMQGGIGDACVVDGHLGFIEFGFEVAVALVQGIVG